MIASLFKVPWSHYTGALASGLERTLEFTVLSSAGAIVFGFVIALMRISPVRVVRFVAAAYTELVKNVPLVTWLFILYYGLTSVVVLDAFTAGSVAMAGFYAAYLAEIFRAGLQGVDKGQREAAETVGLSRSKTILHVVLPQALRLSLAGTATMIVDLLKSTALLVTIAGNELMTTGQIITSETFRPFEVYCVVGALYFAMCYPTSQAVLWLERRLQRGDPLTPNRRRLLRSVRARLQTAEVAALSPPPPN